jgi:hypothetical protein
VSNQCRLACDCARVAPLSGQPSVTGLHPVWGYLFEIRVVSVTITTETTRIYSILVQCRAGEPGKERW